MYKNNRFNTNNNLKAAGQKIGNRANTELKEVPESPELEMELDQNLSSAQNSETTFTDSR